MGGRQLFAGLMVICTVFGSVPSLVWARPYQWGNVSPLTLQVEVPKDTFHIGEPIDGTIVVQNSMGGSYPVTFNIKLYHNNQVVREFRTEFQRVFFGRTEYSFKDFGIPPFNDAPAAVGEWNVSILQQDMDVSNARYVVIHVIM